MSQRADQLYVSYSYYGRLGDHLEKGFSSTVLDMPAPKSLDDVEQVECAVQQSALDRHGFATVVTNIMFFHQLN